MTLNVKCDDCGKEGTAEEIPKDFSSDKDLCSACLQKVELTELTEKRDTLVAARANIEQDIVRLGERISELQRKASNGVPA